MVRALFFLALILATVFEITPARAQSASPDTDPSPASDSLQAAREMVSLMGDNITREFAAQMTIQMWPAMVQGLRAKHPRIDPNTLGEMRREFERQQIANARQTLADAPEIYARYFTADELRSLTAFYRSPIGAKMLRAGPRITAELAGMTLPDLPVLQDRLSQAFNTILRQHGYVQ